MNLWYLNYISIKVFKKISTHPRLLQVNKHKQTNINCLESHPDLKYSRPKIGEDTGTPLQYSGLENPMDGGAWKAAVHGVAEGRTRLSNFTFTFHVMHWRRKWQPTPVFLPGESQGRGSLVGCRLWGRTELDTTEVICSSSRPKI